ncbi:MAG: hypothetical protein SFZ23_07560 [Planctomycetota bacterium]|nr:hypothetical protein [Planctomycetota bacterium]
MNSHALTQYHALYQSVRSRRARPLLPKGIDAHAGRAIMKLKARRVSTAWLRRQAELIDAIGPELRSHSDGALDAEIERVRELFVRRREDEAAVRRGLALTREVARRATGEEAFVVQIMGALALYEGRIIEMLTGEGKTLTGSLAAPLIAWRDRHLHVFTVNDYLAARDAQSREAIYARCGCGVGAIQQEQEPGERALIYARSIVYGTPKQITADWLRDQIRMTRMNSPWAGRRLLASGGGAGAGRSDGGSGPIVPGLHAALVDEADAVLIDEGVVPLIIARSRREDEMGPVYRQAALLAQKLDEGPDFSIDHIKRKAELKRRGLGRLDHELAHLTDPIWRARRRAEELVRLALVARHCYHHGKQYQIVDGKVMIVDEYTGRFLPDRQWEHGLHQSVEAKESLDVTADRETLARQSFQSFFRTYRFMCGMTGTAADATGEMERVYARPVMVIPTNRPIARVAWPMRVFRSAMGKWAAIVASIQEVHDAGRPILVGTRSIAASEFLSELLTKAGLDHRTLNALHDREEAEMVTYAGRGGAIAAITVATNMAGRGTDIRLDDEAKRAGGLHVILTEMHGAQRIDRQFIGRAGRQGDPGSSQVFVSLEDELLTRHAPVLARWLRSRAAVRERPTPQVARALTGLTVTDELASPGLARRAFRLAQARNESRDRRSRVAVMKQDDWVDKYLPGQ